MGWLPDTPDELFGAIVIVVVLGAVGLVVLGRLLLWVSGWSIWQGTAVNPSAGGGPDYVVERGQLAPHSAPFRQEPEPEREPERVGTADEPPLLVDGKRYTAEQIATIQAEAEERGRAEALGKLLGRQLVDPSARTVAMELIFGARGRRHQRVRPLVEAAAASVAPPAAEARLVPVNDGQRGHIEL